MGISNSRRSRSVQVEPGQAESADQDAATATAAQGSDQEMGGWHVEGCSDLSPKQIDRLRRRITRFRGSGMFDMDKLDTTIERAVTTDALREAYSLVHQTYVESGYIRPRVGDIRVRVFEAMPEMATFVARADGRVVAVTSVVDDSPSLGLPSDDVFGQEIAALRDQRGSVCEITNLAIDAEYRNGPVFLQLTQACFAHALAGGSGNMFIAISPSHARFFHEVLQFQRWGSRRGYSAELEDIVEGMRYCVGDSERPLVEFDHVLGPDLAFLYDFYFTDNPCHDRVARWQVQAELAMANPPTLRELFLFRSDLLLACSDKELDTIQQRWGDKLFWSVWGEPEHVSAA